MGETIHIAITRRVRRSHLTDFERALADFASRSLAEQGMTGVHILHPAPDSGSTEYGILRSFQSARDLETFYHSTLYRDWVERIQPMVEGEPQIRHLSGLEAWFREGHHMPPRWKMAVLTFLAVWPVSIIVPALLRPFILSLHFILQAGLVSAGIVIVLTWVAMPLLVKLSHPWLHPASKKPTP